MMNTQVVYITGVLLIVMSLSASAEETTTFGECKTPDGFPGTCIYLENCTSLYDLLMQRNLRNEQRQFLLNSQCGSYGRRVLVCCKGNHITEEVPKDIGARAMPESMTTITEKKENVIPTSAECTTPNDKRGSCIPLENCTSLTSLLLQKPLLDRDRLFLQESQCNTVNGKVFVCCQDQHTSVHPPQKPMLPEPGSCGHVLGERIHGGTVTKLDEFPWFVQILYNTGLIVKPGCAGSLINDRYVLTAAHCFARLPSDWTAVAIRLGEWDTKTDPDCIRDTRGFSTCADHHVDITIESTMPFPDYASMSRSQSHDVALVRMSRSIEYTEFIQPICLPVSDNLIDNSFDGIAMDVAGFGRTESGTYSTLKLKATVHGISFNACRAKYATRRIHLGNSQMCAGGKPGVDTCKGDSGAALVALDNSNKSRVYYYAAGIVSFGPARCGSDGWPGIYTRVSSYIDWIKENIKP